MPPTAGRASGALAHFWPPCVDRGCKLALPLRLAVEANPTMKRLLGLSILSVLLGGASVAFAQAHDGAQTGRASQRDPSRHTTTSGDTGLWMVPTAEVLQHKKCLDQLQSGQHRRRPGIHGRQPATRSRSRSASATASSSSAAGTPSCRSTATRVRCSSPARMRRPPPARAAASWRTIPLITGAWSGNKVGDAWVGGKVKVFEGGAKSMPLGVAVRGQVKLPVGDDTDRRVQWQAGLPDRRHRFRLHRR